ncbi:GTPase activating protein 1-like [Aristolochia californica]|uniref:GTPase activating protein 1-like n=1 Tax=Aristolochia californica TaxID=171875 RepID=UPI0035DEB3E7
MDGAGATDSVSSPVSLRSSYQSFSSMEQLMGLLRVRVVKGLNLAVRDLNTSDPYIILKMGKQKLKTHVVKKNVNPEWNEELTFSISDPIKPIKLAVFDKDTFSHDDKMGDAEIDILPFIQAVKLNMQDLGNGTVLEKLVPNRQNCLAEESRIVWLDGKIVQDVCVRLRNVECGEVELQLQWINLPGRKAF